MAIEINSNNQKDFSGVVKIIKWLAILILVVVVGLYLYFYFGVTKKQATEINKLNVAIAQQKDISTGYSENDLRQIEKEINDYKMLLGGRPKISKFFLMFEGWVHPQVYFTSLNMDTANRTVNLTGVVDDFQPLIQQIAILKRQPSLERYELFNIAKGETGGITFSLLLVIRPEILK